MNYISPGVKYEMQFFTEHPFQLRYFKTIAPSQVAPANNKKQSAVEQQRCVA